MKKQILISSLLVIVLFIGFVGYDLAQLQAGLEQPTEAVTAMAAANTQVDSPHTPIASYESFSVQVETEAAEAEEAAASGEDSQGSGTYAGMFLDKAQMERYWDMYAAKPFSVEKPSLIAVDGLSPDWQIKLDNAYKTIGESGLPVWFLIARYDNVVIPDEQRETANEMGASHIELESGHYIQLDVEAVKTATIITGNLDMLSGSF